MAATDPEIAPLLERLPPPLERGPRTRRSTLRAHHIDILTTGVGMVATAAWCSRACSTSSYDLALNVGVCGSFDRALAPGTVVHVTSDRIVELGAEDGDAFLSIHDLQLLGEDEFPFRGGQLVNGAPPRIAALQALPAVSGITVNTAHGRESSIAAAWEILDAA